jgi:hypothetical protein
MSAVIRDDSMPIGESTLQDLVFLAVGISIMVCALIWARRLGSRPTELSFEKLGLHLKTDRMTLIFLLGFVMAGIGVFFRYQGYESQVKKLQGDLSQVDTRMDVLTGELQNFKEYDLGLNIVFPADIDPRGLKFQVYARKLSDDTFKLLNVEPATDIGGTWVSVRNLSRGEKIKVVAQEPDGTIWESNDIEIPKSQIQMIKKSRRP